MVNIYKYTKFLYNFKKIECEFSYMVLEKEEATPYWE